MNYDPRYPLPIKKTWTLATIVLVVLSGVALSIVLFGVLVVAARGPRAGAAAANPATAPAAVSVQARDDVPPPPPENRALVSAASFSAGVLDECVEVVLTAPGDVDAAREIEAIWQRAKTGMTRLYKTCRNQFPGRAELAGCRIAMNGDGGVVTVITSRWYDYAPLAQSDARMRECAKRGGQWEEVDRNGPVWRRARLEHLGRIAGQMQDVEQ